MKKIVYIGLLAVVVLLLGCETLRPPVDVSKEIFAEAILLGAGDVLEAMTVTEMALHEATTHEEKSRLRKERHILAAELAKIMAEATVIVLMRQGLEE